MPLRPFLLIATASLSLTLFCNACGPDSEKKQATITGRWELRKAFRNQKETGNLSGTFFSFGTDGKMETNLTGSEEAADYSIQKNEILQQGSHLIKYRIQSADDSTLVLVTTMRGIEFELQLAKAPELPQETMPADTTNLPEGDSSDTGQQ